MEAKKIIFVLLFGFLTQAYSQTFYSPDSLLVTFVNNTNSTFANDKVIKENLEIVTLTNGSENIQENSSINFNDEYLSGDWNGLRSEIYSIGFNIDAVYKNDLFSNLSGGFKTGTKSFYNFDLIISSDLEKLFGLYETNLVIHFLGNGGGAINDLVEASQGISNIETVPSWKLYQLLVEKNLFDEKFSILFGLYDLNSEFDSRQSSSIFLNPSHGIGDDFAKSGLNGPSIFPNTSLALRFKINTSDNSYFQAAFLDGVPGDPDSPTGTKIKLRKDDGLLIATEFALLDLTDDNQNSKVAFGSWFYTHKFDVFENALTNSTLRFENNYGFYITAEKLLFSNSTNSNSGLKGFIRLGSANPNVNPVDFYFGTGFCFDGIFSNEQSDALGFALAFSHNSKKFRDVLFANSEFLKEYELNIEATYRFNITKWMVLQPDIQYIINPSYCAHSNSAFVTGMRIELNF
jgi:porin